MAYIFIFMAKVEVDNVETMIGKAERKNLENLRKVRAFAILAKGDMPKVAGKEIFIVPSQHDKEKRYTVSHNGEWECTCPDFQKTGLYCKHIQAVQMWLKMRENIDADILELKDELDAKIIRCDKCGSRHVIKRGKGKQSMKLDKDMNAKNVEEDLLQSQ